MPGLFYGDEKKMSTATEQLAINGGEKVRTEPWPARALFGEEEKQAAIALFDRCIEDRNAYGYDGVEEKGYTAEFIKFLGVDGFADAVCTGTASVYVALRALDLEPFTEVICPPMTDPGGLMPVVLQNMIPVICDAEPGSYNMGPKQIEACITPRTSAIIVAHISGMPADMDPILELAAKHNIKVIEDCAQAHGAKYKGRMVGTMGDVGAFSTMFGKHHATGGQGGVVFTKDRDIFRNVRYAADRGKPYDWGEKRPTGNVLASLNLNQDEMGCAIGRVQLAKLPDMIRRRQAFANEVKEGLQSLQAAKLMDERPEDENVYWFLFVQLDLEKLSCDKATFVQALRAEGITPAVTEYNCINIDSPWFTQQRVWGTSQYPWSAPEYKGDRTPKFELPNIHETLKHTFRIGMDESYGSQEAKDIVAAIAKVEAAYLK